MKKNKLRNVMSAVVAIMIISTSTSLNGITAYSQVTDSEVVTPSTTDVETSMKEAVATGSLPTTTETPKETELNDEDLLERLFQTTTETEMTATYKDEQGIIYKLDSVNQTASVYGGESSANVNIPEEITSDGQKYRVTSVQIFAFFRCRDLTSIKIPSSVTSIDKLAFANCWKLKFIDIDSNNNNYSSDGTAIYNKDKTELVYVTDTNEGLYTVENSVISIGEFAFCCNSLTSITMPEGITSISKKAFAKCSGLTTVKIPSSVKKIEEGVFFGCDKLSDINIPEGVISIGEGAFKGCESLKSVKIPEGVTSIGDEAFEGCDKLESVTISEGVPSIGKKAFFGCGNLTSIKIPKGVTSIGDEAFECCDNLESVIIAQGVTSIGDKAFESCWNVKSIVIPKSVTSIGEGAFYNCTILNDIIIPGDVKCIGDTINDRCNYVNTILCNPPCLLEEDTHLDNEIFQSNDGVLFYKVKSPEVATDTVTKDATSTATISPTTESGDISALMIIAMLAIGTVGMAKTKLVRK